jgi:GTP-dependent phosphoenolpyruvate carboxykinase
MKEGRNIEAKINKGVRQGCNLSPAIFNMYMEGAIKEIEKQGIKVNGEEINMLLFPDDIAIVAGSKEDLQNSLNTIEKIFQEYNVEINKKKNKVLVCGRGKTVADIRLK